ncbi:MAG: hypothetical protein U9R70_09260 [Pseudomonadota bacterium]|uniref:hypothetical protein n=1 Tax=Brevundimonas sp. GW460-12-10-14-LB2 TaxID=1827469 RepID=UPI0018D3890F|nr:hypothetical protein [Brevundimonas sp. GW460-12-10-14-LB2]MEA3473600.1 hypothetical protein [Pseudomonadota bacterium]
MFYVLGGLMLLYQAWLNWRLQRALSGFIAVPADDQIADGVIALGGVVVLMSGVALAALSAWAVVAFLAGWAIQAAYLLWVNRADLDSPLASGRLKSVHAFAGYTAVTGVVLWLPLTGVLG